MNTTLMQKLARIKELSKEYVVTQEELHTHPGFTLEDMEKVGLSKKDLHKLESLGLARRGYTKNTYLPGEYLPKDSKFRGRVVKDHEYFRGNGSKVRWILIP